MFGSRGKWVVILLLVNGVLLEVDHGYKTAMHVPTIIMPNTPVRFRLPSAAHNSPLAETPFVQAFDRVTITSGTMMVFDEAIYSEFN